MRTAPFSRPDGGTGKYDNTLYIEDTEALVDSEVTLSVRMKNSIAAEGFAFDLILPYGMTVATDSVGNPMTSLSEKRTTAARTNTFASSVQPDGSLTVMAASTNASRISSGDGEVCTARIRIAADMAEGDYALTLRDVAISDTQAKSYDVALVEGILTIDSSTACAVCGLLACAGDPTSLATTRNLTQTPP